MSLCSSLVDPFQVLEGCCKVFLETSLLQAEQPQLAQPFLTGEVFQPSFLWPPLDLVQQVHVFPVLRAPELDAGLQVGSEHNRGTESPPLTCWACCWGCSPGCGWPAGVQAHIGGSC